MPSSIKLPRSLPQKVVIITGTSSGIGRATVEAFSAVGWRVVATMRTPENENSLQKLPGVTLRALDVTNTEMIHKVIKETHKEFGRIDAMVNNAGYGLIGAFEELEESQIRRQFETNVFGLMAVCREVIPFMRAQKFGHIINISSVGGRVTFPLYSAYHATKWAVEGFTESLQFELSSFGIKTVLIEPGAIRTDFYDRSADRSKLAGSSPYKPFADHIYQQIEAAAKKAVGPEIVASKIVAAASNKKAKQRYAVGGAAPAFLCFRKVLPEAVFNGMLKRILKIKT